MRKTKLSFDLFARQQWQRRLIYAFLPAPRVRHPPAKAGLKGVHRQDCRRQPPTTALSRQGGYAHTLKGYFYTNLGGTLITPANRFLRKYHNSKRYKSTRGGYDSKWLP
jgi:hypothetical protein